jgi:hypothetical protein
MILLNKLAQKIVDIVGSRAFSYWIIGLFVVQALWIALTTRYPLAFDEDWHFGIIKLHAEQWLPFFDGQPLDSGRYGGLARDPSYLFHFLMSLPYRLIATVTDSLPAQVISLRLICIGMFASGLVLFRRVLDYVPTSPAIRNLIMMFFSLIPVAPLLAAQINYDNLIFPLSALSLLLCLKIVEQLRQTNRLPISLTLLFLSVIMLSGIVKYAFLPIFLSTFLIVLVVAWRTSGGLKPLFEQISIGLRRMSKLSLLGLGVLFVLSLGLFAERYVVNTLQYHTPTPECDQVLSVEECMAYGPWARNHRMASENAPLSTGQITAYPEKWLQHTQWEMLFTITSRELPNNTLYYHVGQPIPITYTLLNVITIVSLLLLIVNFRWLWQQPVYRLFLIISLTYVAVLFLQNFMDFLNVKQRVAVHGRYLFPILPLLMMAVVASLGRILGGLKLKFIKATNVTSLKVGVAVLVLLLYLPGAGIVPYIVRSEPIWFWPQSSAARSINQTAQNILKPIIPD